MPQISVILPTYNRVSTLPRAISSILAQSFQDWDLWLIDDGSTDTTAAWLAENTDLQKLGTRFHYRRTENRGVSAARNVAIHASDSQWLAFLDSDDEWLPHKLARQIELSEQQKDAPLIHGEEIWIRNGVRVNPMKKHQKRGGRIFRHCLPLCCISPSTAMIQSELLKHEGSFREDFPVCEDYELWLRICSRFEVGFIPDPITVKHGGHEDQLSRRYFAMDYWRVKAMAPFLSEPHLSQEDREAVAQEMAKKCDILMRGYEKHANMLYFSEVRALREQAMRAQMSHQPGGF